MAHVRVCAQLLFEPADIRSCTSLKCMGSGAGGYVSDWLAQGAGQNMSGRRRGRVVHGRVDNRPNRPEQGVGQYAVWFVGRRSNYPAIEEGSRMPMPRFSRRGRPGGPTRGTQGKAIMVGAPCAKSGFTPIPLSTGLWDLVCGPLVMWAIGAISGVREEPGRWRGPPLSR